MTKEKVLESIKKCVRDYGGDYNLNYDEATDSLFHSLDQVIGLDFAIELRSNACGDDYWLQCEYWSEKLKKTVIWDYDVGNFDDYNEVADYVIRTTKLIKDFEAKISLITDKPKQELCKICDGDFFNGHRCN